MLKNIGRKFGWLFNSNKSIIHQVVLSALSAAAFATGAPVVLVQHPGGAVTPADTPEVAAIKSQYNAPLGRGIATDAGATINGVPIFASLSGQSGFQVPIETPENVAIKSQYTAALGLGPATDAGATINGVPIFASLSGQSGYQVPIETPQVAAIKSQYYSALGFGPRATGVTINGVTQRFL